jgi:hypothetical protein
MADKTVIVEVKYDTNEAIKNVKDLTSVIEGEKIMQAQLKEKLEAGKISQKEYSIEVEKSKNTSSKANAERKATIQLLGAEKGSISEVKAEIKKLSIENESLNLKSEEGRKQFQKNNVEINKLRESLKGVANDTGETKGAFATFGDSLSSLPGPLGEIVSGIGGMTKAGLAFIATPIGLVIAAIAIALKALMSYFKGSEEGQNRLNKVLNIGTAIFETLMDVVEKVGEIIFDAVSKPKETIIKLGEFIKENLINRFKAFGVIGKSIAKIFSGEFKEGFKELANGAIQMGTGVENAIDKIGAAAKKAKDYLDGVVDVGKEKIKLANQLSDIQAKVDKREREMLVERAKIDEKVSELRLKATEKDTYSQKERIAFLTEAKNAITGFTQAEIDLAQAKLNAAKLTMQIDGDTKENLKSVAEAEANLINVRRNALDERRGIQKQLSTMLLNEKKESEESMKTMEDEVNKIIDGYAKIEEYDRKAKEDQDKRRGEAIAKLAEAKSKELEIEAKSITDKYKIQADAAGEERARQLKQKNLLKEEEAVIEAEFDLKMLEINANYQNEIAAQRQDALNQAFDDMQKIIAATGEMGDARVNIISDSFSKIATINFSEIKNSKEAFIQIGQAAQGLTSLITQGHQAQLDDLTTKKNAELLAAGDNDAKKAAIEAKYNKKAVALKKAQFKEDKAKAIIDALIATALAVAKSLPNIPLAIISGVLGAVQIGVIASRPEPNFSSDKVFAKGGIIGGSSHAQGGTKFWGSDGSMFEAEKGEAMFVLKKDATSEIAALSMINESFGGRSFSNKSHHLADGGQAESINIENTVNRAFQNTTIVVKVGDIETGLTNFNKTKQAGVI